MFGWDETGAIELNDLLCTDNTAVGNGGCFYVSGGGVVHDGTVMTKNEGKYGGCICECVGKVFSSPGANIIYTGCSNKYFEGM